MSATTGLYPHKLTCTPSTGSLWSPQSKHTEKPTHLHYLQGETARLCQVVQATGNLSVRSHILAFFSCIKQDWLSVSNTVTQSFVCGYFTRAAPSLFEVLERTAALWPAYTNTYKDNLVLQQKLGRYPETGILTVFTSRYASRPYSPISLPFPDAL